MTDEQPAAGDTPPAADPGEDFAPEATPRNLLTPREIQILMFLAHGHTLASTGRRLHITRETVKSHLGRIHSKLNARTQAHAVVLALKAGHIHLDRIKTPPPRQP